MLKLFQFSYRFTNAYKTKLVEMITINGNLFILVNSMAFENDGCNICNQAQLQLNEIEKRINCAQVSETNESCHLKPEDTYLITLDWYCIPPN